MKETEGYIKFKKELSELDNNEGFPVDEPRYTFRDMRCAYEDEEEDNSWIWWFIVCWALLIGLFIK